LPLGFKVRPWLNVIAVGKNTITFRYKGISYRGWEFFLLPPNFTKTVNSISLLYSSRNIKSIEGNTESLKGEMMAAEMSCYA